MRFHAAAGMLLLAGFSASAISAPDVKAQVDAYRHAHEPELVARLDAFTRLRSIAADPEGLKAAAAYLEEALKQRGFEAQQLSGPQGSAPLVFGFLKVPGAKRTVAYYAHYDGQPVTPSQWATDPFKPVVRAGGSVKDPQIDWQSQKPPFDPEWRLYARAVSDDKATIMAFLAAFDALKAAKIPPSVNIKVLWEGEEEAGSIHLGEILGTHKDLLKADLFLIGDGPVHQTRKAMVNFGARGTVAVEATLYGPIKALHDGHYGNWVPNPAAMAANLIASIRDDEGRILIPGFLDDVRPVTQAEQQALEALPLADNELKHEFAVGRTEGGESLPKSLMRPAINIRGIRSGQVGEAAANAIPVNAEVSIDFRLVPNQTPKKVREQFEAFLKSKGYTIVESDPDAQTRESHGKLIKLKWESGYPALRSDLDSREAKAVIAAASKAAGYPVVIMPMVGGSVPLYIFDDTFHSPIICMGIANHDNNQHAANENLRLKNLWDGIDAYAALISDLHF